FGDLDAPNSLSMFLCMTTPVLLAGLNSKVSKPLKALCAGGVALASIGVLLTISRTGVVTLGLVLLSTVATTVAWKLTPRKVFITMFVVVAAAGALAKSWNSLSSRFGEATLQEEYEDKHA